jgi:hypothetical protein
MKNGKNLTALRAEKKLLWSKKSFFFLLFLLHSLFGSPLFKNTPKCEKLVERTFWGMVGMGIFKP